MADPIAALARRGVLAALVTALLLCLLPGHAPMTQAAGRVADPARVRCPSLAYARSLAGDKNPDGSHVRSRLDARGRYVPVVMIHGWTGRSAHTDKRDGAFSHLIDLTTVAGGKADVKRSLIGQLQRIPGAAVYTFDYHEYSGRWVDDRQLGPAFGEALDCLFRASGEKAVVVGHSMGGLVARWALTHRAKDGRDRTDEVSTVVTFGTPEEGSLAADLLAGATGSPAFAVLRTLLAFCGEATSRQLTTGSLCDVLPDGVASFDSTAGRALRAGSADLRALKPFPRSVHLAALAGDTHMMTDGIGWFGLRPWGNVDVPMGDMIVSRGSALAAADEEQAARCSYELNAVRSSGDSLALRLNLVASSDVPRPIWEVGAMPCFHSSLMRTIQLTNTATGVISEDITGRSLLDLHTVDWRNAEIPGGLCRSPGPIRLRNGVAVNVPSDFDGPEDNFPQDVYAFTDKVVHGDLTGDGRDEAALPVMCANHDSTAAGQTAMGVMVFDGLGGRPKLIGTLTSQQERLGEPPNFIEVRRIGRGRIVADETFYGSADANCCPSGRATDIWSYADGKLTPKGSTVTVEPTRERT
ncbi:hypothetical protein [Streptomyces sp. NPDC051219]|uniref:PGAP1-like alpha/beta domain-containing protein n=1 Tax=Streptomyces sp. NPDC051219 TaxID=3155283 RepID=UPI00343B6797